MIKKKDYQAGFFLVLKIEDRKSCQIVDKKEEVGRSINDFEALEKSFRFDSKLSHSLLKGFSFQFYCEDGEGELSSRGDGDVLHFLHHISGNLTHHIYIIHSISYGND